MRRLIANKKGQFIVIAVLMVAIMTISVASIMYSAVTYYRHERWGEYLSIIDNVEITAYRLVEISLAKYTATLDSNILKTNLDKWQRDLLKTYPEFRVVLNYSLVNGAKNVYGTSIYYNQGLNMSWNKPVSFSAANATFAVNITSVGLTGYKFMSPVFLRMKIVDAIWYSGQSKKYLLIYLIVDKEGPTPITNLQKSNFVQVNVSGTPKDFTLRRYYDAAYGSFVYGIRVDSISSKPPSVGVTLVDTRSIKTVSFSTNVIEDTK